MERLTKRPKMIVNGEAAIPLDTSRRGLVAILNRLAAIEDILGDNYDLAHLRELVQAEKDGRLVVLPCGETISSLRKAFDMAMRRLNAPALPSPSYTTGEIHGYDSGFVTALGRIFLSWRTAAAGKEEHNG